MIIKDISISEVGCTRMSDQQRWKSLIAYPEKERLSDIWHLNCTFDNEAADAELFALALTNPRSRRPMRHMIMSWKTEDNPGREQIKDCANELLKSLGLADCLAKCAIHFDTDNVHLHVIVCTVDPITEKSHRVHWIHEEMAKTCAVLERRYGWKPEPNPLYQWDANNQLERVRDKHEKRHQPEKAGRMEAHQGQRSAVDIAREVIGVVSTDAHIQSWTDFHRAIAKQGCVYELRGKGAVIGIMQDDHFVYLKASNAGAGLSALEARFGNFIGGIDAHVVMRYPEPMATMPEEHQSLWAQYEAERTLYFEKKRKFVNRQKTSDRALDNELSSNAHGANGISEPVAFPENFQGWLDRINEVNQIRVADVRDSREISMQLGRLGGYMARQEPWGVEYSKDEGAVDLIDRGYMVEFGNSQNETLIAGIQLAIAKWPKGVKILGTDEFKRAVVDEMVAFGLCSEILNTELQEMMRERLKNEIAPTNSRLDVAS